jgi:hypothetical protein
MGWGSAGKPAESTSNLAPPRLTSVACRVKREKPRNARGFPMLTRRVPRLRLSFRRRRRPARTVNPEALWVVAGRESQ